MRWVTVLLAAVVLGLPGSALAGGGSSAHPLATTRPARALTIRASGVNGDVGAVISDWSWRIHGVVADYVPRQHVTLHVFRNGVPVLTRTLKVGRRGRHGVFNAKLRIGGIGRVTVRAIHAATAAQGAMASRTFGLWLVAPEVQAGQHSYAARILQHQLSALHYVVGAPGVYDQQTQWAVMAFRKVAGLPRNFIANAAVFDALAAGAGHFVIRFASQGRHIEADLTHQVIALIGSDGVVQRIYAISSGKPSTPTVLGNFAVYEQTPGVNGEGMVDSNYFYTGYAIHGYPEVPNYPASHGCLRVWIPDALSIFAWVRIGMPVDVYYR
jgi:hypothetical protein